MSQAVIEKRTADSDGAWNDRPKDDKFNAWRTILFNCDCHNFNEVIRALLKANHCSLEEAKRLTWDAHTNGRTVAYTGHLEKAELVCSVLESFGLLAKVSQ